MQATTNLLPELGLDSNGKVVNIAVSRACSSEDFARGGWGYGASGSGYPGLQELRLCFGADGGCGGLPRNKGATLVGRYSV